MIKKTLFFASLALMVSCQDSIYEFEVDSQAEKQTRSVEMVTRDYYWFGEEKIPVRKDEAKTFILYRAENEEMVMTYLPKSKDGKSPVSNDFDYYGTDMAGNSAKDFLNCKWVEVDASCEKIKDIPGIIYSASYYFDVTEASIPLTNLVYVSLKSDSDVKLLKELAAKYNVGIIGKYKGLPHLYIVSCTNDSAGDALQIANVFHESGLFEWSQPSFLSFKLHSNDPKFAQQWNLVNTGQLANSVSGVDINYANATSYIPSSSGIVVAVIDNGVQLDHPDLSLTSFSWDAYSNHSPSSIYDYTDNYQNNYPFHGTSVAGIISAKTNNSIGIAGIAPCIKTMPLSVNFQTATTNAQLASAIRKAVDQGADVINCSWGGMYDSNINSAINYAISHGRSGKGCVVVCSTGNGNQSSILYPACYSPEEGVISVGAISPDGTKTVVYPQGLLNPGWGSNYGNGLDLMAPGIKVPSTSINSSTTEFWGTSCAAPHVSAVAALMLAQNNNLTYKEVGYLLQRSANKIGGYDFGGGFLGGTWNNEVGYGLLDMTAALSAAHNSSTPTNSISISGNTYLTADYNNYAGTTLTVSPNNYGYTYFWSATFTGSCDRWYLWPNNNDHGPSADISVYLNPGQYGGTLRVTCSVYNGATFLGRSTSYVNVSSSSY